MIFSMCEVDIYKAIIFDIFSNIDVCKKHKKNYLNIAASLDIETTSITHKGEKHAYTYVWVLNIDGLKIVGRTWEQYQMLIHSIMNFLPYNVTLIIYAHNLGYEFQFMRGYIPFGKVFARKSRKPITAAHENIEYRCSLILSGFSLATLGKQLEFPKLEGYNYKLKRHHLTPLTPFELSYVVRDTDIVVLYIINLIEQYKDITKIPLTQTGFVRNELKSICYPKGKQFTKHRRQFREKMSLLTINDGDEYALLKRAFMGGFTHANVFKVGKILQNVLSFDLASAYPAVMFNRLFPMGRGMEIDINTLTPEKFNHLLNTYHCIFDIGFENINSINLNENIISAHKCRNRRNVVENNGRVVSAAYITTTMCEVDFEYLNRFYEWDTKYIYKMYVYPKGKLPHEYATSILKYFNYKTSFKDVEGKEEEYMHSKQFINSIYGMTVTDINPVEVTYDGEEWHEKQDEETTADNIEKYNKGKERITYYPWGVYVTAYVRSMVYRAILAAGDDYVYSDTDSVKIEDTAVITDFFEGENTYTLSLNKKSADYYSIDDKLLTPITPKGKVKNLGVWEQEETADRFKTLGAKRYLVQYGDRYKLTISGVNPVKASKFVTFAKFKDGLKIPSKHGGGLTATYLDAPYNMIMTDHLGNKTECQALSGIHMEDRTYTLGLSQMYIDYIETL